MSGVYINGMEMPTTCGNCWFCRAVSNEKWHCRLTGKSFASYSVGWGKENNTGENGQHPYIRRDDCPLVPVPPLVDLIDRNALLNKLQALYDERECEARYTGSKEIKVSWSEAVYQIINAPTIIPADDPKEE